MKRIVLYLGLLLLLIIPVNAESTTMIYFEMNDPIKDDSGYGNYQYPTHKAFEPYRGVFDLTKFKVWSDQPGVIYFDTTFAKITNPWQSPEGFIHQNLRIYLDTISNAGLTQLPEKGANVSFDSRYAWDFCLKVVGWGNSKIFKHEGNVIKRYPLNASLLADQHTIRVTVPVALIGEPLKKWNYYVLVGSYDGFGEDFFRKVAREPSEWLIGGSKGSALEPRVMDLLALEAGNYTQNKQLQTYDLETQKFAILYPVGASLKHGSWWGWFVKGLLLLLLGGLSYIGYQMFYKKAKISWFWVKNSSNNSPS